MEKNKKRTDECVLGVAPSARGFGFAVVLKGNTLVDWGVKSVKSGKKNEKCIARFIELIEEYRPGAIAVEDCSNSSKRNGRVKELVAVFLDVAAAKGIRVCRRTRMELNARILKDKNGTKHELAQALSLKFSEQLGFRMPKKRRLWTSESYQMDIFDAVALAQCYSGQR